MKKLLLLLTAIIGLQTIAPVPQAHADIKDTLLIAGIAGSLSAFGAALYAQHSIYQVYCSQNQSVTHTNYKNTWNTIIYIGGSVALLCLALKFGPTIASLFTSNNSH